MLKLICRDQPEEILSAVYEAWADPCPNRDIEIVTENTNVQEELFCVSREAVFSRDAAEKTADSIRRKLSDQVWTWVLNAIMSDASDKAQAVFVFLRRAFSVGPSIVGHLAEPAVMRVFELSRMVSRETHSLLGFARFSDAGKGILLCTITPRHNQIPLIADHFANRFCQEKFIIYDRKRGTAAVHIPGAGWYLTQRSLEGLDSLIQKGEEDIYGDLWSIFFRAITIEQRLNPVCQRNLLPIRFRPDMTEFRRNEKEKLTDSTGAGHALQAGQLDDKTLL